MRIKLQNIKNTKSEQGEMRLLLLGDAFVGKSSLINALCNYDDPLATVSTIGCSTNVFKSTISGSTVFIELLDPSGASSAKPARDAFFIGIDGIVFVFDTTRAQTFHNIKYWIKEIVETNKKEPITKSKTPLSDLPTLCIGTKTDLAANKELTSVFDSLKVFGIPRIFATSREPSKVKESIAEFLLKVFNSKNE